MFFDSDNTKEAIKTRMLRIALTYWETRNTDELDPLVKFLMDALSAELYDVVNDIRNAEGRILEKMAHLLAPDLLTAPAPAHAVMQALPGEASEVLTDEDQFYFEKKIASKPDGPLDTTVDIYFSATNKVRIFDAQIRYLFSGTNLYTFDQTSNKLLTGTALKGSQSNECCIWLGINANSHITDINSMAFFFDLKNMDTSVADFFYQFLPFTSWYVDNSEIKVSSGLYYKQTLNKRGDDENITDTDLMYSIVKNINNYYEKKFITVSDDKFEIKKENLVKFPGIFKNLLPPPVLEKFTEELLWIKVVFPTTIRSELMNEIVVRANAFPVMNCRKNELRYRLRSGRNIIPIPNVPNERFLAIKSFTDGQTTYKAIPFRKSGEEEAGTYTLRSGGLERFDSRNGREIIQYLLELLRSESAAFSAFGHDFIASTLKEMNQFIALLEQKTNTTINDATEIPNYIIVKPVENQELMFVEYLTTNTGLANNIRSGTRLLQSSGISVKPDSLMLLTSATGGKDKLKSEEKLYAFKYGLLTHERIVTVEDIRSFCFYELGTRLSDATIKKGFVISDNPKEGIKRTIDVILTPSQQKMNDNEEWLQACYQLKSKLQTRSGMTYNYRIFPKTEA
ncbi:MAG: hypothetical protein JWQ09_3718 [Segetibacter sp.]|nr:hypothetical protein [Segetibacter sp.]